VERSDDYGFAPTLVTFGGRLHVRWYRDEETATAHAECIRAALCWVENPASDTEKSRSAP
jgi:hypothetical protein